MSRPHRPLAPQSRTKGRLNGRRFREQGPSPPARRASGTRWNSKKNNFSFFLVYGVFELPLLRNAQNAVKKSRKETTLDSFQKRFFPDSPPPPICFPETVSLILEKAKNSS
jgi:hypothetical protein